MASVALQTIPIKQIGKYIPPPTSNTDIIKKLRIKMDNPPRQITPENNILIIRHAFSEFNYVFDSFLHDHRKHRWDELTRGLRFDPAYFDPDLHEIGVRQAKINSKHVEKFDVHTVFISPMKRTMKTAMILFRNHPYRHRIRFYALPLLTEIISMSSALQSPTQYENVRMVMESQGVNFKYMRSCNKFWQIDMLQDEFLRQYLQEQLAEAKDENDQLQTILAEMENRFPQTALENRNYLFSRTLKVKEFLKDYIQEEKVKEDKKIVLVSHQATISCLLSEEGEYGLISKGLPLENCEMEGLNI